MCLSLCWVLRGRGSCNEFRVNRETSFHARHIRRPIAGTQLLETGWLGSLWKGQDSVDFRVKDASGGRDSLR